MRFSALSAVFGLFCCSASALTIREINGPAYLSPYNGQNVSDVSGLVTAVGPSGFFVRDPKSPRRSKSNPGSNSLYVFGAKLVPSVAVGDIVTLSGKVEEYRSNKDYIFLTELTNAEVTNVSSGNAVAPVIIGRGRDALQPPVKEFTGLDRGNVFGVPNNQSLVSTANPTLKPDQYGLDFWESLSGELVTIDAPVALGSSNNFGDIWVRGNWHVTGLNKRGGLTITASGSGVDANPETIIIGSPLDKTKNSEAKIGDQLSKITGVVTYAFGFYRILPTTAVAVTTSAPSDYPATALKSTGSCKGLSVGQYNVENLSPNSAHLPKVADHIVNKLLTPDLLFLQEVQDNDGSTDSGTVSADLTLGALIEAIEEISGFTYNFADIAPSNNQDGGQPGGNIRVSYLYNPALLSLSGTPGSATDAATVPLTFNPSRIAPTSEAWTASRKPLVAAFTVKDASKPLYAINVHFGSKGGSSSIQGDARPPVNGGVADRQAQAELVADFVRQLYAQDNNVHIVAAGDFNEFSFVAPMEALMEAGLKEADDVVGIPKTERYSYTFDMNSQQLDHTFFSTQLGSRRRLRGYEHLHVNTWAGKSQVSDHDPAVAVVDVC